MCQDFPDWDDEEGGDDEDFPDWDDIDDEDN